MRTIWVLSALLVAVALACGGRIDPNATTSATAAPSAVPSDDAAARPPIPKCPNPCSVSWRNDIWPLMSATGAWKCGDKRCHGAQNNAPYDLEDQDSAYASLASYTIDGRPYLAPCNPNPSASSILCNLDELASCGTRMPYTDHVLHSGPVAPEEYAKLKAWVACGSPKN